MDRPTKECLAQFNGSERTRMQSIRARLARDPGMNCLVMSVAGALLTLILWALFY